MAALDPGILLGQADPPGKLGTQRSVESNGFRTATVPQRPRYAHLRGQRIPDAELKQNAWRRARVAPSIGNRLTGKSKEVAVARQLFEVLCPFGDHDVSIHAIEQDPD